MKSPATTETFPGIKQALTAQKSRVLKVEGISDKYFSVEYATSFKPACTEFAYLYAVSFVIFESTSLFEKLSILFMTGTSAVKTHFEDGR